jgi:hypothetical protein
VLVVLLVVLAVVIVVVSVVILALLVVAVVVVVAVAGVPNVWMYPAVICCTTLQETFSGIETETVSESPQSIGQGMRLEREWGGKGCEPACLTCGQDH